MDGEPRLTYLSVVVCPAGIHCRTTCTYLTMKLFGELKEQVEAFFAAYAITSGNYYGCTLQVVLRRFHVSLNDLHDIALGRHIVCNIGIDCFAGMVCIEYLTLHHSFTYSSHLGTVVGIDDGADDVSSESGSNLIEQVLIVLPCFAVVIVANLELGAVGS